MHAFRWRIIIMCRESDCVKAKGVFCVCNWCFNIQIRVDSVPRWRQRISFSHSTHFRFQSNRSAIPQNFGKSFIGKWIKLSVLDISDGNRRNRVFVRHKHVGICESIEMVRGRTRIQKEGERAHFVNATVAETQIKWLFTVFVRSRVHRLRSLQQRLVHGRKVLNDIVRREEWMAAFRFRGSRTMSPFVAWN